MEPQHQATGAPSEPQLCNNNCGFFGNPATEGMCSKCWRDRQTRDPAGAPAPAGKMAAVIPANAFEGASTKEVAKAPEGVPTGAAAAPACVLPRTDAQAGAEATERASAGSSAEVAAAGRDAADGGTATTPPPVLTPRSSAETRPAAIEAALAASGAAAAAAATSVSAAEAAAAAALPPDAPSSSAPTQRVQTNRKRCFGCNKKVGLLGFECRCGFVFCSAHRHAQDHNCDFDFLKVDRERIAAQNPVVTASKLRKF